MFVWFLALLASAGEVTAQSAAAPPETGVFVPLTPTLVHPFDDGDLAGLASHQVVLVFDVEDTPANRKSLRAKLAKIPGHAQGGPAPLRVTLFGETGRFLSAGTDPPAPAVEDPFFPYRDPASGKSYLCIQPFWFGAQFPNYVNIGRVLAVQFTVALEHGRLPLRQIHVNYTYRRAGSQQLTEVLGKQQPNDPQVVAAEVVAWSNAWLASRPSLEAWARQHQLDLGEPRTRQLWEGAISTSTSQSVFTLAEGAAAYYRGVAGRAAFEVNLYEDDFELGRQETFVSDRTFRAPDFASAWTCLPVMETLWTRLERVVGPEAGSDGGWEELGTQYIYRDMRGEQVLSGDQNLVEITIEESFSLTDGRSRTDEQGTSTTDSVEGSVGLEAGGLSLGGSVGQDTTRSRSRSLSNSTEQTKTQRCQTVRKVQPGNLILLAMPYKGRLAKIEKGQWSLRRYVEIVPAAQDWIQLTLNEASDRTLKAYGSTTEEGGDRAKSSFGKPVDPEILAVLGSLLIRELGERSRLAGKWQQVDLDDGEVSFVLVGGDGAVYDGSLNRPGADHYANLTDLRIRKESGTVNLVDLMEDQTTPLKIRLVQDGARGLRKLLFSDLQGNPRFVWYRR